MKTYRDNTIIEDVPAMTSINSQEYIRRFTTSRTLTWEKLAKQWLGFSVEGDIFRNNVTTSVISQLLCWAVVGITLSIDVTILIGFTYDQNFFLSGPVPDKYPAVT